MSQSFKQSKKRVTFLGLIDIKLVTSRYGVTLQKM